jgi:hypothetical protein
MPSARPQPHIPDTHVPSHGNSRLAISALRLSLRSPLAWADGVRSAPETTTARFTF